MVLHHRRYLFDDLSEFGIQFLTNQVINLYTNALLGGSIRPSVRLFVRFRNHFEFIYFFFPFLARY